MKKKSGPQGPRKDSAASLYRKLITEGKTDAQVWRVVEKKFPGSKNLTKWYRWSMNRMV